MINQPPWFAFSSQLEKSLAVVLLGMMTMSLKVSFFKKCFPPVIKVIYHFCRNLVIQNSRKKSVIVLPPKDNHFLPLFILLQNEMLDEI